MTNVVSPMFIAEISANHLGSFERAKALVLAAIKSGASAVKFQTYTAATMTLNLEKIKKDFSNEPRTSEAKIKFLRAVGFNITDNAEMRDALEKDKKLVKAVSVLYNDILKKNIVDPLRLPLPLSLPLLIPLPLLLHVRLRLCARARIHVYLYIYIYCSLLHTPLS